MPQAPSTRWCPTPEQLMILEEMYMGGVRTPNASQIQQITTHLSFYGKIEGKNVFYWFQNHKARDRQKLRRRLCRQHQRLLHGCAATFPHFHNLDDSPLYNTTSTHSIHQGCPEEEAAQGLNLLCKLETGDGSPPIKPAAYSGGYDWMAMVMMDSGSDGHPCCRPLMTLDLFPTKSTGLKDECSTSKSSSCSISTN